MSYRSKESLGGTCRPLSPPTDARVTSLGSPEMGCRGCVLGEGVCVYTERMSG